MAEVMDGLRGDADAMVVSFLLDQGLNEYEGYGGGVENDDVVGRKRREGNANVIVCRRAESACRADSLGLVCTSAYSCSSVHGRLVSAQQLDTLSVHCRISKDCFVHCRKHTLLEQDKA